MRGLFTLYSVNLKIKKPQYTPILMRKPLLRYPDYIALILFELKLFHCHVLFLVEYPKHINITSLHIPVCEYSHL